MLASLVCLSSVQFESSTRYVVVQNNSRIVFTNFLSSFVDTYHLRATAFLKTGGTRFIKYIHSPQPLTKTENPFCAH